VKGVPQVARDSAMFSVLAAEGPTVAAALRARLSARRRLLRDRMASARLGPVAADELGQGGAGGS